MLQAIQQDNKQCRRCHLCEMNHHIQVVPGLGGISKIMVCAEAPGHDENILGEPLVGRCGKLFDKVLDECGLRRDSIYITNAVKCQPPKNRNPDVEERVICKHWLWKEIQACEPQYIITLGKISTMMLLKLNKTFKMKDILGKHFEVEYMKSKIVPCYHPSYILRNGNRDFQIMVDIFKDVANAVH
jgi:uracil-DNA glycosylase family 4